MESGACPKCGGAGWIWWYEHDDTSRFPGQEGFPDDTKYPCDWCSLPLGDEFAPS